MPHVSNIQVFCFVALRGGVEVVFNLAFEETIHG